MESHQLNNQAISCEESVIEALTLDCEMSGFGVKIYRNKEGQLHRIYGPAVVDYIGNQYWYKNDKLHREDGPAIIYSNGNEYYYVTDIRLSKEEFIQWQIKDGIKPIE